MDMAEEDASKIINRFCGTKNKKNKIYIYYIKIQLTVYILLELRKTLWEFRILMTDYSTGTIQQLSARNTFLE